MDTDKITKEIAECIYLGIVHDTGVFQYSCTSSKTMEIAGKLMDRGIDYSRIVDDTFYIRTFAQQQILGKALQDAELHFDGRCISSVIKRKQLEKFHVEPEETEKAQKETVSKKINAKISEYIDKNVNNK